MDLRYGDMERALALAFSIQEKDLGAFRGRIRHLRKADVAGLPQPGTGRQIVYTFDHVHLLFLALRLNQLGLLPEVIGRYFEEQRSTILGWFEAAAARPDDEYRVALAISTFGGQVPDGIVSSGSIAAWDVEEAPPGSNTFRDLVRERLERRDKPYIVMSISAAARAIEDCLVKTLRTP